jgi:hypothetical protein
MSDPVSINIDRKTVEAVLTAQVTAAVAATIGHNPGFMDGIVSAMVNCKVDSDGKPTTYGGESITAHIARKVIHEAVRVAVAEWANEQKPAIAKALRKHMEAKRGDIIKRFCEQAEKALDVDLGVSIRIREPS